MSSSAQQHPLPHPLPRPIIDSPWQSFQWPHAKVFVISSLAFHKYLSVEITKLACLARFAPPTLLIVWIYIWDCSISKLNETLATPVRSAFGSLRDSLFFVFFFLVFLIICTRSIMFLSGCLLGFAFRFIIILVLFYISVWTSVLASPLPWLPSEKGKSLERVWNIDSEMSRDQTTTTHTHRLGPCTSRWWQATPTALPKLLNTVNYNFNKPTKRYIIKYHNSYIDTIFLPYLL